MPALLPASGSKFRSVFGETSVFGSFFLHSKSLLSVEFGVVGDLWFLLFFPLELEASVELQAVVLQKLLPHHFVVAAAAVAWAVRSDPLAVGLVAGFGFPAVEFGPRVVVQLCCAAPMPAPTVFYTQHFFVVPPPGFLLLTPLKNRSWYFGEPGQI